MGFLSSLLGIGDDDCSHEFRPHSSGDDGTATHKCIKCGKKEDCYGALRPPGKENNYVCKECGQTW